MFLLFIWNYRSNHRRCSVKKVFLKISQNSRENTCARDSFLIKVFSCEFCEISKNTFFTEHLRTTPFKHTNFCDVVWSESAQYIHKFYLKSYITCPGFGLSLNNCSNECNKTLINLKRLWVLRFWGVMTSTKAIRSNDEILTFFQKLDENTTKIWMLFTWSSFSN